MPNHTHFLFYIDNPKSEIELNEFGKTVKNSASSIINQLKGRVTKYTLKENIDFHWQSRFYDHIVRDNQEFSGIQKYIIENPQNWEDDKFFNQE